MNRRALITGTSAQDNSCHAELLLEIAQFAHEIDSKKSHFTPVQKHWSALFLNADKEPSAISELELLRYSFICHFNITGWNSYFHNRAKALLAHPNVGELNSEGTEELQRIVKRFAVFAGTFKAQYQVHENQGSSRTSRKLTIGIDIRALSIASSRRRGIGRYLINTIAKLIEVNTKHNFVLLSERGVENDVELHTAFSSANVAFRQFGPDCDDDLDVFLLTDPMPILTGRRLEALPISKCIWMSLIFDFIPLELPDLYLSGSGRLIDEYLENIESIASRCKAVFPISLYVAEQCKTILSIPANRVIPILGGVEASFFIEDKSIPLDREVPAPYFLYVGGADARKNIHGLIKSFQVALDRLPADCKLIFVGEMSALKTQALLTELKCDDLQDRVIGLGIVEDSRLKALYSHALATVFVSFSEGLGLPALEAMATGCPVIASKTSALGETVGNEGLLVDPFSIQQIADGMIEMTTNEKSRNELAARGPEYARKWTWESVAKKLLDGIEANTVRTESFIVPKRKLRVAMLNRENVWSAPGGDSKIMHQMKAAANERDIDIYFPSTPEQIDSADLVHFVNMTLPVPLSNSANWAQANRKPFVVTTLFEDWPKYLNASHQAFGLFRAALAGQYSHNELCQKLSHIQTPQTAPLLNVTKSLQKSALLLTCGDSEATRLCAEYPEIADRIVVLPFEVNIPLDVEQDALVQIRSALGFDKFVLCIGRLETRKNQLALLAALHEVDIPIVFATGSYTPQPGYASAVKSLQRKAPVLFVERMPWHSLSALIRCASVHALPSFYELPGLVHLECATAGIPIVASDWGAIGDYMPSALYHHCDPLNLDSIRNAVLQSISTPVSAGATEVSQSFTQERLANGLSMCYEMAMSHSAKQKMHISKSVHRLQTSEVTGGIHAAV